MPLNILKILCIIISQLGLWGQLRKTFFKCQELNMPPLGTAASANVHPHSGMISLTILGMHHLCLPTKDTSKHSFSKRPLQIFCEYCISALEHQTDFCIGRSIKSWYYNTGHCAADKVNFTSPKCPSVHFDDFDKVSPWSWGSVSVCSNTNWSPSVHHCWIHPGKILQTLQCRAWGLAFNDMFATVLDTPDGVAMVHV